MTRRKGEVTSTDIRRSRRAACGGGARPGELRGDVGLAKELGAAPYPLSDFHDGSDFVVFHRRPRTRRPFTSGSVVSCCRSLRNRCAGGAEDSEKGSAGRAMS
jgi:hypothetical protein